jgi:hypothetical protein
MYIDLIRRVLEEAIETYAAATGKSVSEVLTEIREHIDATAKEHEEDEPDIQYQKPLCRLGYLYRHAPANATLFELILRNSGELRTVIRHSASKRLNISAIGGGPGTELLGLTKFLMSQKMGYPKKIAFAVLDAVPQWAETWQQLADASEEELEKAADGDQESFTPTISPAFLDFDVLKPDSYKDYAYQFRTTQIIVFNYIFSENKTRLAEARAAVQHLYDVAPSGCVFAVIDRLERSTSFQNDVVVLFRDVFGSNPAVRTYNGTMAFDEQTSDMGDMLYKVLGYPRVKFFTQIKRHPTVFWFTCVKV